MPANAILSGKGEKALRQWDREKDRSGNLVAIQLR
jgi:hypothetical protein